LGSVTDRDPARSRALRGELAELDVGRRSVEFAGVVEIAADVVLDDPAVAAAWLPPNYSRAGS
jgi:hypothetical protein